MAQRISDRLSDLRMLVGSCREPSGKNLEEVVYRLLRYSVDYGYRLGAIGTSANELAKLLHAFFEQERDRHWKLAVNEQNCSDYIGAGLENWLSHAADRKAEAIQQLLLSGGANRAKLLETLEGFRKGV